MATTIKDKKQPAKKKRALSTSEKRRRMFANAVRSMNFIQGTTTDSSSEQLRNMNKECGYPDEIDFVDNIVPMYEREGVAQRVVHVYPVETWKTWPSVYEVDEPQSTPFEEAVDAFCTRYHIWSILERADKLSGIGCFGVVLLGVNDSKKLKDPIAKDIDDSEAALVAGSKVEKPLELKYLRVFDQRQVSIDSFETDEKSPRYGKPKTYKIKMVSPAEALISTTKSATNETIVHWQRIVHLADNRANSEIAGVPRLEPAYNRILDLLKVLGGSSEMFWKGGFPGLSFEVQPGLEDLEFDVDAFKEEIDNYANGLQRYLRLLGVSAKSLAPQVADPTPQIQAAMDQICVTINCPKRIFLGTESAHLASTQDQKTWMDRVYGRRLNYAIPYIIRPFFIRMIQLGVLPMPAAGDFKVDWRDADEVDPLVRAQALEKIVNAMAQYATSGLASLVQPIDFLVHIVKMPLEMAQLIVESAEKNESKIKLVKATDANDLKAKAAENKGGSFGTNTPGKSGRKPGSGKRRESKAVSTGQNGG